MKKLSIILCIIWIGVIFLMSSDDGISSNKKSYFFVDSIKKIYQTITKKDMPTNSIVTTKKTTKPSSKSKTDSAINRYVRKTAHFTEYSILGLLVTNALFVYNYKGRKAIIYILFICLLTGVLDEFNQSFITRTSEVSDVLIDFSGAVTGMFVYYFCYYKLRFSRVLNRLFT